MAHFDFTRPGCVWTGSPALLTAEIADLDSKTKRALNGDDGGTWAPTTTIVVGGQGLEVTGVFISSECQGLELTSGEIVVYSGAQININSGGEIELTGDLKVNSGGNINVLSGGEIEVRSGALIDAQAGSTLSLAGAIDIESGGILTVKTGASLGILGTATLLIGSTAFLTINAGATVAIAADVTQTGKVTHSGTGGRTVKRVTTINNASASVGVGDADYVLWNVTTGSNYDLTLKNGTGPAPQQGESIEVRIDGSSAGEHTVIDESTGLAIYNFTPGADSFRTGVKFVYVNSLWRAWGGLFECYTSES
jgi:hypothetical protein